MARRSAPKGAVARCNSHRLRTEAPKSASMQLPRPASLLDSANLGLVQRCLRRHKTTYAMNLNAWPASAVRDQDPVPCWHGPKVGPAHEDLAKQQSPKAIPTQPPSSLAFVASAALQTDWQSLRSGLHRAFRAAGGCPHRHPQCQGASKPSSQRTASAAMPGTAPQISCHGPRFLQPEVASNMSLNRSANGRSPWPCGRLGSSSAARPRRPTAVARLALR